MNCQHIQKLIGAHHDGELDIASTVEIDEHLAECPSCAQARRGLSDLGAVLKNDALRFQTPAGLRQRILAASAQTSQVESNVVTRGPWFYSSGWAAAAAFAIVALVLGLQIPRRGTGDPMVAELTSSHVRSLMANHLMDVASTDQHTVKPWFDGKLDFAPPVKDLRSAGFPLIGGRLDYAEGRPVAALVYGRQKHLINMFVWPGNSPGAAAPRVEESNGYHLVGWSQAGMKFWVVSDLNQAELLEFVKLWTSS